ncbi:pre-rRNA-processing protein esf1 [Coemansia sp. Benny D115]|nr:pre-rRNA-processing protein esf1 [Coemansia sp. Benny D115]
MAPKESKKPQIAFKKVTDDARFSHVQDDPRFRRPKKNLNKVKVDKRFANMINDKDFTETSKVDKYGRVQEDNRAEKYLRNIYDFSGSEAESESGSGSESESESGDDGSQSGSEEESEGVESKSDVDSESESEGESENESESDIRANLIDRARGRGVRSDESSDDSDDSDISDVEWGVGDDGLIDVIEDPDDIPRGEETKRFACVNMDWDHVRAIDLLTVFVNFKPDSGTVISVKIYPSDFGKERMSREAIEGPPKEVFLKSTKKKSKDSDESSSDSEADLIKEQVDDNEEFDQIALRKYEMERLRYYFAVVECDSIATAQAIYNSCDGSEYEASANFFDLRFIPDDIKFEDKPKDEAFDVSEKYEPVEFSTEALRHSKVKLTWDTDAPERTKVTRRAFTQDEIDKMDFGNLLASSSEGEASENEDDIARKRALLLSGADKDSDDDEDDSDDDNLVGDMEITFNPGLSEAAELRNAARAKEAEQEAAKRSEETAIDRFRRLKKEKRQKWKESKKAGTGGNDNLVSDNELGEDVAGNDFFSYSDDDLMEKPSKKQGKQDKKKLTKQERMEKQEKDAKERAELELLLDGAEAERKHFDMAEIIKAEKRKGKKGKHAKKVEVEDDFKMDTSDPRFGALFESHNFAIDPNNPNFKKTKAMKNLLEESRKRRKTNY